MMVVIGGKTSRFPIIGKTPAEDVLKELVAFAKKKENWFNNPAESAERSKKRTDLRPEGGFHAPCARHVDITLATGEVETYHVVFTITEAKTLSKDGEETGKTVLVRHATLGIGDMDRLLNAAETYTLLTFLGFNMGSGMIRSTQHPDFHAQVFLEPLTEAEEAVLRAQ